MYKSGASIALEFPYKSRTNGFAPWTSGTFRHLNNWEMVTYNHPRFRGSYGNAPGDNGGPFFLEKDTTSFMPVHVAKSGHTYPNGTYTGLVVAGSATGFTPAGHQVNPSESSIISDGATAISRVHPSVPEYSLAQQMGEMRERFPTIIGSSVLAEKVALAKGAGQEYLNVEFGWRPLINSVIDFARTVKGANSTLNGYVKRAESTTRRRYDFPQVTSFVYQATGGIMQPSAANIAGSGHLYERKTTDKWFEGSWLMWIPVGDSLRAKILRYEQDANKLLGTRLTPDVLWELAPWSWAVDWYTNIGDVFTNLSAVGDDSTVMKYGYMMVHQTTTYQLHLTMGSNGQNKSSSKTVVHDRKQRLPASPYGFGVEWADLTPRQTAIAAAVGLTRS